MRVECMGLGATREVGGVYLPCRGEFQGISRCSFLFDDENGPVRLSASFSLVVGDSGWSYRATPCLLLDTRSQGRFFLVVLGFHLVGSFFQSSFGLFVDFLHF